MPSEMHFPGSGDPHDLPGDPWERVTRELRACKESQRRAWGDTDNTTLGRYLAGEATAEERAQVEQALEELPELRKLTALVRDVLNDLGPLTAEEPVPLRETPSILPFAAPRPAPKRRFRRLRRYASLAAAACLLVAAGAAMPRLGGNGDSRSETRVALADGMASLRGANGVPEGAFMAAAPAGPQARDLPPGPLWAGDGRLAAGLRMAEKEADANPAPRDALSPKEAANFQRMGSYFRAQGDLNRAEEPLSRAAEFCTNQLGLKHPATRTTVRELAGVYGAALNTPAAPAQPAAPMAVMSAPPTPAPALVRAPATPDAVRKHSSLHNARLLRERIVSQPTAAVQNSVVPVLLQAITQAASHEERQALIRALGQLGPAASTALPVLADRLVRATHPAEIREVLGALEQMGPAAKPAVPVLRALLGEERPWAGRHLAKSEARFKSHRKHPRTLSPETRKAATQLLGRLEAFEGRVGIRDEAGCFSVNAVREASSHLLRLAHQGKCEVHIETRNAPLPEADRKAGTGDAGERSVMVVITPSVPAAEVRVSEALRRDGFPVERLRAHFLTCCKEQNPDRALADGVQLLTAAAKHAKK